MFISIIVDRVTSYTQPKWSFKIHLQASNEHPLIIYLVFLRGWGDKSHKNKRPAKLDIKEKLISCQMQQIDIIILNY